MPPLKQYAFVIAAGVQNGEEMHLAWLNDIKNAVRKATKIEASHLREALCE